MQVLLSEIGVAILSTDRVQSLKRLLDSIDKFTNSLTRMNIAIFDDSVDQNVPSIKKVCNRPWLQFVHTGSRLGIAKNTNHALRYLKPFKYKLLLNNDVEILKQGWQFTYPFALLKTGYHCFCHRQLGLWGACKEGEDDKRPDSRLLVNEIEIATVPKNPHGAIIAFDQRMQDTVGFFDAKHFHGYGMSHHFWTNLAGLSGLQPEGFHDIGFSNLYFLVHNEQSVTPQMTRFKDYKRNQQIYAEEIQKIKTKQRKIFTPDA